MYPDAVQECTAQFLAAHSRARAA